MPSSLRNAIAGAAAAALLVAAPALAGGIDIRIECGDLVTQDADGTVPLRIAVFHQGCIETVHLAPEKGLPGPAIGIERLDGEKWVAVEDPWVAEPGDEVRASKEPIRMKIAIEQVYERRARLGPGTYRLVIENPTCENPDGTTWKLDHAFASDPLQVVARSEG